MVIRSRGLGSVSTNETWHSSSGSTGLYPPVSRSAGDEVEDTTILNPGGNNPWRLERQYTRDSRVNGAFGTGAGDYVSCVNHISSFYSWAPSQMPSPDWDPSVLTTRLFRAANPYRSSILLPAFLLELRDLPKMIYDLGRIKLNRKPLFHSANDIAKQWVNVNFGWAPLISDLNKLADFATNTLKREEEFDRLYSSAGLVRRVKFGLQPTRGSRTGTAYWGNRDSGSMPVSITGTGTTEAWGVVRYRPARSASGAPVRRPDKTDLRRILRGMDSDGAIQSAWELLPWSWLIDYVYDVGGFLEANAGRRYLNVERACIMAHTKWTYSHPGDSVTDDFGRILTLTGGSREYEVKLRAPVSSPSLPTPHVPLLSGTQLSILGSLSVMRSRGLRNS